MGLLAQNGWTLLPQELFALSGCQLAYLSECGVRYYTKSHVKQAEPIFLLPSGLAFGSAKLLRAHTAENKSVDSRCSLPPLPAEFADILIGWDSQAGKCQKRSSGPSSAVVKTIVKTQTYSTEEQCHKQRLAIAAAGKIPVKSQRTYSTEEQRLAIAAAGKRPVPIQQTYSTEEQRLRTQQVLELERGRVILTQRSPTDHFCRSTDTVTDWLLCAGCGTSSMICCESR